MSLPFWIRRSRSCLLLTGWVDGTKKEVMCTQPCATIDKITYEEEEELDQPRDEVAGAGDDVLVHAPVLAHVERGSAAVVPDQFRDDDEEEEELGDVGHEADEGADMVKDGLEVLQPRGEAGAEGVVDHGGGVPEQRYKVKG